MKYPRGSTADKLPSLYLEEVNVFSEFLQLKGAFYVVYDGEREYAYREQYLANVLSGINGYAQLVIDFGTPVNGINELFALQSGDSISNTKFSEANSLTGYDDSLSGITPLNYLLPYDTAATTNILNFNYNIDDLRNFVPSFIEDLMAAIDARENSTDTSAATINGVDYNNLIVFIENSITHLGISSTINEASLISLIDQLLADPASRPMYLLMAQQYSRMNPSFSFNYLNFIAAYFGYTDSNITYDECNRLNLSSTTGLTDEAAGMIAGFGGLETFTESDTHIDGDKYIVKYTKTIDEAFGSLQGLWDGAACDAADGAKIVPAAEKVAVISYTSTLSVNDDDMLTRAEHIINQTPEGILLESRFSPVFSQPFTSNGLVQVDPEEIFVTLDEQTAVRDAVQSIDGLYYSSSMTPIGIATSMLTLINENATLDTLVDIQNDLQYILSVRKNDPSILRHLNNYRKAFPNKTQTGVVGTFYENFKTRLLSINKTVKAGKGVKRARLTNPIVRDRRAYSPLSSYESTYDDHDMANDFIHVGSTLWSRYKEIVGSSMTGGSTHPATAETLLDKLSANYALVDDGFWFFNFEKAIKTKSEISKHFNVNKFETIFGNKITNGSYQLGRFSVSRRQGTNSVSNGDVVDEFTTQAAIDLYIDNSKGYPENKINVFRTNDQYDSPDLVPIEPYTTRDIDTGLRLLDEATVMIEAADDYGGTYTSALEEILDNMPTREELTEMFQNTTNEYSFLALRNFAFFSNVEGVDPNIINVDFFGSEQSYRMAVFQFSNRKLLPLDNTAYSQYGSAVYSPYDAHYLLENILDKNFYVPSCYVADKTGRIVYNIWNKFDHLLGELYQYESSASDTCSYNDDANYFNQFFIDGMNARYPDRALAPYIKAPIMFYLLDDLLNDTFDGDKQKIYEAAKNMTTAISPETGNLESLQTFYDNMVLLKEELETMASDYNENHVTHLVFGYPEGVSEDEITSDFGQGVKVFKPTGDYEDLSIEYEAPQETSDEDNSTTPSGEGAPSEGGSDSNGGDSGGDTADDDDDGDDTRSSPGRVTDYSFDGKIGDELDPLKP